MTDYPERRTSRMAGWSRGTASFAAVLLVTDWIGHHYDLVETPAFLWVLAIVALLAALALMVAGFGFTRIWNFGDLGGRDLIVGVALALVVLAPYGVVAYRMLAYPPLHDISTDLDTPPDLPTAVSRTGGMNSLASLTPGEKQLQSQDYPLVTNRSYDLPPDETIEAVEAVLKRQGWQVMVPLPALAGGQTELTIGALARSFGLDLPVDVAIRVSADGDSTLVDMRSSSRYGRHDLGDNAMRIIDFLDELDQQVTGQLVPASNPQG